MVPPAESRHEPREPIRGGCCAAADESGQRHNPKSTGSPTCRVIGSPAAWYPDRVLRKVRAPTPFGQVRLPPLWRRRAPFIEDDAPATIRLPAPDRGESADQLAAGVMHGPAGQRQCSGGQNLDRLGPPGERGLRLHEELPPRPHYRLLSSQCRGVTKEHRLGRYHGSKGFQVAPSHAARKAALRGKDLLYEGSRS